ncbi:hypothetical protein EXN13_18100 [Clostridium botulinum]|nr:hypothetical protein [Clostridium botulinum]NFF11879.1 hypothetical protein [Clostridium botulinum]
MPINYCRTPRLREELVANFYIKPYAHVRLLNGQTKKSATGDTLERSYYCFTYSNKNDSSDNGSFICGKHAGDHFCRLLNVPRLTMFNPLQEEHNLGNRNANGNGDMHVSWDTTAKQLYNAINIIIMCWDNILPNSPLIEIKEKIERCYYRKPSQAQIKAINTIISRDYMGRTIQDMLTELRDQNEIREFEFTLLNEVLVSNNKISHFG